MKVRNKLQRVHGVIVNEVFLVVSTFFPVGFFGENPTAPNPSHEGETRLTTWQTGDERGATPFVLCQVNMASKMEAHFISAVCVEIRNLGCPSHQF